MLRFTLVSAPLADSDAARDGARHVPRDARHAGQPARSRRRGRQPAVARGPEEPRRGLRARQAALGAVRASSSARRVRGDFGQSFVYKTRTVTRDPRRRRFPVSLLLGSMALVLAVAGGVTLGVLAAVYQNRSWDYVSVTRGDPRRERAELRARRVPDRAVLVRAADLSRRAAGTRRSDWVLPTVTLALGPDGHHRALHALEHDRGDPLRLHRDRARQGPGGAARSSSSTCSRTPSSRW